MAKSAPGWKLRACGNRESPRPRALFALKAARDGRFAAVPCHSRDQRPARTNKVRPPPARHAVKPQITPPECHQANQFAFTAEWRRLASRSGEVWSAGAVSAEAGMAIAPTYPDFCIEEITGVSTPIARSRDSSSAGQ
jgi:hypothetical protein